MTCATHPERETERTCQECGSALCEECQMRLGENTYCAPCVAKAQGELRSAVADMGRSPNYIGAVGLGFVAALLGAVLWERISTLLHLQIGFVSIAIGFAVGWAVVTGSGNKRGRALQVLALVLSAVGIALGIVFETHSQIEALIASGEWQGGIDPWLVSVLGFPFVFQEMGFMTWIIAAFGLWQAWTMPAMPVLAPNPID